MRAVARGTGSNETQARNRHPALGNRASEKLSNLQHGACGKPVARQMGTITVDQLETYIAKQQAMRATNKQPRNEQAEVTKK